MADADPTTTALARFWSRVEPEPNSGCWLWSGTTYLGGYGRFTTETRSQQAAHRWAYEHYRGPVPSGLQLDHLCRVRCCVNPDHLEAVTARVNTLRGRGRTSQNAAKTHCVRGHEFTPENTRILVTGKRNCRECLKVLHKRRKRRRADEHLLIWKEAPMEAVAKGGHPFQTDGTARNRCVHNYPDGKQCRKGFSARVHQAPGQRLRNPKGTKEPRCKRCGALRSDHDRPGRPHCEEFFGAESPAQARQQCACGQDTFDPSKWSACYNCRNKPLWDAEAQVAPEPEAPKHVCALPGWNGITSASGVNTCPKCGASPSSPEPEPKEKA